jgi:2-polyprenyl-6-methoxyphenol hydroxylase-like FAD-dependent oxidoreductase
MNRENENKRTQAIVLGASLGGLMTARVLSNHFKKVIIIEKDVVNRQPESRKGQPQTRHLHGLLPAGFKIISHYFPDIKEALEENGASVMDFAETMVWNTYGGYRKPVTMNLNAVLMSRPLLEHLVRERVLALPNVELMDNTSVKNLIKTPDNQRITGIVVEQKGNEQATTLNADLVIDVTGRASRSVQWLTDLGYDAPPVSEVKVNVGYATRLFKRDPNHPLSKSWMLYTPQAPVETRFAGMFPVEGDRWVLSVGGWHGDSAPLDEASFMAYVKSLPMPEFYDTVSQCEPLSDIVPYKFQSSLRRHYEKLTRFPLGYLVLGDAVSSFNPTYGQGMTAASMQAAELDKVLTENIVETKLATTFFKRIAKVIDIPWGLAVGEDFRFPATEGPKPPAIDFINKYVARVHRATLKDEVVCKAFLKVMSLIEPPTSLFRPNILWRVIRA